MLSKRLSPWLGSACALYLALAWLTFSMSRPPGPGSGLPGPGSGPPAPAEQGERLETYAQASDGLSSEGETWQSIRQTPTAYVVRYGFRNFNQDTLTISVDLPAGSVD